ncbi:GMC oxidoreductase [Streptomyces sp. SID3343]|uniref:GMC family oxidoreductase N-terminal domain-containing protein n=1 Tax=Streptomyces sp. SID3343 TaxID=2690260 RepID=UPI001370B350|nr:glucose-methanol-choline oxidoreductase [Streptomyces sp. SID3343]
MRSFEVVVVGAGSAGCVVAARMSARHDVLLIEAGPAALPEDLRQLSRPIRPPYDWGDTVDSDCRELKYARGRVVGGSSATNGAVALRPEPEDFDTWPANWSWDDMLPRLNRIEHDLDFGDRPYHGIGGPIPITRHARADWAPFQAAFAFGCTAAGLPYCPDHNAPVSTGVGAIPMNRQGRTRVSNAAAYLAGARDRVTVRADTHVARVVLAAGRAVGVELADGTVVRAGRVILAAGVVQTPLLLARSGLAEPNPHVGRHLTDHAVVSFAARIDPDTVPDDAPTLQVIAKTTAKRRHDLQLTPVARRNADGTRELDISVSLQLPAGAGTVSPTGTDPSAPARITWPFLAMPDNVRRLRAGWRLAATIARESGILLDARDADDAAARSDADVDDLIRRTHYAFYHGVGTCRMAADPADGVVDPMGAVFGVSGLHIVDASVIPTVPRSNTHLLVTALAERWCDLHAA